MATRINDGDYVDYTAVAAVTSGDVIVQDGLVGIVVNDGAIGDLVSLAVKGEFEFTKTDGVGTAITAGADVFYDAALDVVQEDSENGANAYVGKVTTAAGDDDTCVSVLLARSDNSEIAAILADQVKIGTITTTPASGTCAVSIQLTDGNGVALTEQALARVWHSATSKGAPAAVTDLAVDTGTVIDITEAEANNLIQSSAAGVIALTLTNAAGTTYLMTSVAGKIVATEIVVNA